MNRRIVMISAGVVLAVSLIVIVWQGCGGGSEVAAEPVAYHCFACGHKWKAPPELQPTCPECGAPASTVMRARCPECGVVAVFWRTRKLGPGQFEYQLRDSETWKDELPPRVRCPVCNDMVDRSLLIQVDAENTGTPSGAEPRPWEAPK